MSDAIDRQTSADVPRANDTSGAPPGTLPTETGPTPGALPPAPPTETGPTPGALPPTPPTGTGPDSGVPATTTLENPDKSNTNSQSPNEAEPSKQLISPLAVNLGFVVGLFIAVAIMVCSVVFLFKYLDDAQKLPEISPQTISDFKPENVINLTFISLQYQAVRAKVTLLACGVCSALSMGFLGFVLFLLGISGDSDVTAEGPGNRLVINKLAPGTIVILVSLVVICICCTHNMEFGGIINGKEAKASAGELTKPPPAATTRFWHNPSDSNTTNTTSSNSSGSNSTGGTP
jgi:hypothetical protein